MRIYNSKSQFILSVSRSKQKTRESMPSSSAFPAQGLPSTNLRVARSPISRWSVYPCRCNFRWAADNCNPRVVEVSCCQWRTRQGSRWDWLRGGDCWRGMGARAAVGGAGKGEGVWVVVGPDLREGLRGIMLISLNWEQVRRCYRPCTIVLR